MNLQKTARDIVEALGGADNISNLTNCMTRLRFKLNDESKADFKKVEAVDGVLGLARSGGEQQIIIGTDVDRVFREIQKSYLGGKSGSASKGGKKESNNILEVISAALSPIIPAIMGAAFISIILALLVQFNWISADSSTYQVLNGITSAVYHFFPVLIALTLSARLKVNQVIAVVCACFLMYPAFITLIAGEAPATLFGLPIMNVTYAKAIIPIFLSVYCQKYIEKGVYAIMPKIIKTMVGSGLVMILTVAVTVLALGPLGALLTEWINAGYHFAVDNLGWFAIPIIAFINPIMLGTGLGTAAFPVMLAGYLATGYEGLVLAAAIAGNAAQAGSGFAIALKSRNKELKAVSVESGLTALMGITEPIIFSVHYRLKRTLWSVMAASFVAAFIPALAGVKCYALATGVLSLPAYLPGGTANFVWACVSILAGLVLGFIITYIVGFKDPSDAEYTSPAQNSDKKAVQSPVHNVLSPVDGKLMELSELSDKAFSAIGTGVAVVPTSGKIYAPIDGIVTVLGSTMHAVAITGDNGLELLIHIGEDTVKLGGKHFTSTVKQGDRVKAGDLLVEFDKPAIEKEGYNTTLAVIVVNHNKYLDVFHTSSDSVAVGDKLITVI